MGVSASLDKITWVIMDVDGVLTDGSIIIDSRGVETKSFNVWDGAGIKYLHRVGLKTALVTGRSSQAVEARAAELGVTEVIQDAKDKLQAYEALLQKHGLSDEEVAYIGDDLTDLPMLRRVGFAACVPEAPEEVKSVCDHVTSRPGGKGAVRELVESILKCQGRWQQILKRYEPGSRA